MYNVTTYVPYIMHPVNVLVVNSLLSLYKCGLYCYLLKKNICIVLPLECNDPECEPLLFWLNVSDG